MSPPTLTQSLAPWLEQAWLQRYLDRLLDESECAWFETYVLDKPHLLQAIDADSTLRDALAAGDPTDKLATLARRRKPVTRHWAMPWLAAAASLALGIGIGGMADHYSRYRVTPGIITNPTRMVYDTLRGAGAERHTENAASESPYVLIEVAVPPDATAISVEIAGNLRRGLTVSPDGFISFLVSTDIRDTARTGTLNYTSRGERIARTLDLQQAGGKANE